MIWHILGSKKEEAWRILRVLERCPIPDSKVIRSWRRGGFRDEAGPERSERSHPVTERLLAADDVSASGMKPVRTVRSGRILRPKKAPSRIPSSLYGGKNQKGGQFTHPRRGKPEQYRTTGQVLFHLLGGTKVLNVFGWWMILSPSIRPS